MKDNLGKIILISIIVIINIILIVAVIISVSGAINSQLKKNKYNQVDINKEEIIQTEYADQGNQLNTESKKLSQKLQLEDIIKIILIIVGVALIIMAQIILVKI